MGRKQRSFIAGGTCHVFNRGNNRMPIFPEDVDHHEFLDLLKRASRRGGVTVHGLVLMTTHYHFLGTPQTEIALPETMKEAGERYARYFNNKYRRTGTLWERRYQARTMEDAAQGLTCLRYIEQNPVKARIVDRPDDYRWSSYAVHALGVDSDWLVPHASYLALGRDPAERQRAYRTLCAEPIPLDELVRLRRRRA